MCCRYLLFRAQMKELLRRLGVRGRSELTDRYNIAPGSCISAIVSSAPAEGGEVVDLHWGLRPPWLADTEQGFANAKAESVQVKPAFRAAFQKHRCLIPASGFYEWQKEGRERLPWLFQLQGEEPFFLAGLWEPARADVPGTCAIITTEPNRLMQPIHPRMPAMFTAEAAPGWLDPNARAETLAGLLAPFPAERMKARPLSKRVNSTAYDDPACLQPADTERRGTQDLLAL